MKRVKQEPGSSLCFRCDHRAAFLEGGHRPRCECGDVKTSVCGCYMYRPVQPVVLAPREDDPRPVQGHWMISARMSAAGLFGREDMVPVTVPVKYGDKNGFITYWQLVEKKKSRKKAPRRKKGKYAEYKDDGGFCDEMIRLSGSAKNALKKLKKTKNG